MVLDDIDAIHAVDRSGMLSFMERTPARMVPPADASSTCSNDFEKPLSVVLGGVGGSGIVGDVITDYARAVVDIPVSVCRTLRLPGFVGEQTLFVAISYSGETEETLGLLRQAKERRAMIMTITSGGRLLSQSKKERIPYLKIPAGLLPRVALPELIAAAVFAMGTMGIFSDPSQLLSEAAKSLMIQVDRVKQSVPFSQNSAKQMAQALLDRLPLLIGNHENESVLRRFKNELNENSKVPAFYYTLPEAFHDDVEGLKALRQTARAQPIFLLSKEETQGQRRTREKLYSLLNELGFPAIREFEGIGQDRLSGLLTAILFADCASAYLAILRSEDPSVVTLIPKFREAMRGV